MDEQSIFIQALEIEDCSQRRAYLDQACGDNQLLRKQVEALLEEHECSEEFLCTPAVEQLKNATDEMASVSHAASLAGQKQREEQADQFHFLSPSEVPGSLGRMGHYDIQQLIGRGGCGIVFKAFDERLHRIVAIKVMTPEMAATSPARKRFLREARATAAIRHENVVSIYAVEESPIPFLVMEYIEGKTLQHLLNETGPLELSTILRYGQMIANGLEAAHQKGLIHRDIKPANILVEAGIDQIRLTDFGLARTADDASQSQSGIIVGTPLYMSPEQVQGLKFDKMSDLFSLGSVLYVMCSGRPPFRARSTLAVLKRVVEEVPRPIQEIIPEVPDWLVAIIDKLHAKDPAQRYDSAQEVADLLAHPPVAITNRPRLFVAFVSLMMLAGCVLTIAVSVTGSTETVISSVFSSNPFLRKVDNSSLSPANLSRDPLKNDSLKTVETNRVDNFASDEGFDRLFNDKNLDGWISKRSASIDWRNENGTITGRNRSASLGSAGHLRSVKQYQNFHFRCEVLAGSGVEPFLLFRNDDTLVPGQRRGYALIEPIPGSPINAAGWGYGSLYADDFQVMSENSRLAPSLERDLGIQTGEWYRLEFIAYQQKIEVRINGIPTAIYTSDDPRLNKAGCICIRCSAGASVILRKLEVKELSTKEETLPPKRLSLSLPLFDDFSEARLHQLQIPQRGDIFATETFWEKFSACKAETIQFAEVDSQLSAARQHKFLWDTTLNG